ncbi:MAG: hypothetical protein U0841_18140 [Chloroflexia bacterium]
MPQAVVVTGATRTGLQRLADLRDARLVACPLVPGPADPAAGPQRCLDRGCDHAARRAAATSRGYPPHIPPKRRAAPPLPPPGHPDRHPPRRWVGAVCHRWFNRFRRLVGRWGKRSANYRAFVQLAAIPILYRKLRHARPLPG